MKITTLELWKDLPEAASLTEVTPTLTFYQLDGVKLRGLVLILPGGGYQHTSDREGEPIALQFAAAGYHAAVLNYRVAPDQHPKPLLDGLRALTMIENMAQQWHIDMSQVFLCGFSAGGHLCASVSNLYKKKQGKTVDGIDLKGLKIKGSILAYPVIVYGEHMHEGSFKNLLGEGRERDVYEAMSMEKLVNADTPPSFLWHTVEDGAVPVENSLMYVSALRKAGKPFELHIYPDGGHGLSLATKEVSVNEMGVIPHVATWMNLCLEWMEGL